MEESKGSVQLNGRGTGNGGAEFDHQGSKKKRKGEAADGEIYITTIS